MTTTFEECGPCPDLSTQPVKMSTRDFSWGKGGLVVLNVEMFRGLKLPGTPRATSAIAFQLASTSYKKKLDYNDTKYSVPLTTL